MVGTGIAIQLTHNTYGWITPQSGLAVKHRLTTNAVVIDADYRGEGNVVLVNQGNQPYQVEQGDRIAQLIIEEINNKELQEVTDWMIPSEVPKDLAVLKQRPRAARPRETGTRASNKKFRSTRYWPDLLECSTEEEKRSAS